MKKVLVTGTKSYIGTSFIKWINESYKEDFEIKMIDLKNQNWKQEDFSEYDAMLYVAGLAHVDVGNVSEKDKMYYYEINRDLTLEVAAKCKKEGIRQFVFMSSMIVYGKNGDLNEKIVITNETIPNPENFYGDSKWQAEKNLKKMQDETFEIAIIRSPMVYGKGSKGNYRTLVKIARKTVLFPDYINERSMIHIDNLCEFLYLLLMSGKGGIYFPQNEEYVATIEIIKKIVQLSGHKIIITKMLNPFVRFAGKMPKKISGLANKAFGNLVYDQNMSKHFDGKYQVRNFDESIELTEGY